MRWNLALAGLAASWGLIAVLAASLELGAEALAFLRLALAAATLGLVAIVAGRGQALRPGRRLPALAVLGAVQAAHWLLFFEAVKHGSVALAVLTFYTAPLFIALAAPTALPERASRVVLGALPLGAVGVVLLAVDGDGLAVSGWALAAGVGSALTFAILVILSRRLVLAAVAPLTVAFWDCLVGAAVVAPLLLIAPRVLPDGGGEWGRVLLLGVVFTGLSTLVYAFLLRHVTAQAAGILTFLEPVSAILLAWLLIDDRPGSATVAGGILVLAAGLAVVVLEPTETHISETPAGVGSPP